MATAGPGGRRASTSSLASHGSSQSLRKSASVGAGLGNGAGQAGRGKAGGVHLPSIGASASAVSFDEKGDTSGHHVSKGDASKFLGSSMVLTSQATEAFDKTVDSRPGAVFVSSGRLIPKKPKKVRPLPTLSHTPINFNDLYEVAYARHLYKVARQPRAFRVDKARKWLGIHQQRNQHQEEDDWAAGLLSAKVRDLGPDVFPEDEMDEEELALLKGLAGRSGSRKSTSNSQRSGGRGSLGEAGDGESVPEEEDEARKVLTRVELTFNRYKGFPDPEVHVDDLAEALHYMGYTTITAEDIDEVAHKVTPVSTLMIDEWKAFVNKISVIEREKLEQTFANFDENGDLKLEETEVQQLIKHQGFTCSRACVSEMFKLIDQDKSGFMDFEEFMNLSLLLRNCQGFTQEELTLLRRIYDRAAGTASPEDWKDKTADPPELPASKLVDVFGIFAGPSHIHLAQVVADKAAQGCKRGQSSFKFHEFVIWCRYLREQEMKVANRLFHEADADKSGRVDVKELRGMLKGLGYTPISAVIDDLAQAAQIQVSADSPGLDFEEFVGFFLSLREMDGFTREEYQELKEMFEKYAGQAGECSSFDLANMLRQLGFVARLEDAARLLESVDCDNSGTLVFGEFLRLMRRNREDHLQLARKTCVDFMVKKKSAMAGTEPVSPLSRATPQVGGLLRVGLMRSMADEYNDDGKDPSLPTDNFKESLLKMGFSQQVADRVVFQCGPKLRKAELSFDEYLALVAVARKVNKDIRKGYAGFSDEDIDTLKKIYDSFDRDGNGMIERMELLPMLEYLGIPMRTKEDQERMLTRFEEARANGRALGLTTKEVGIKGEQGVRFWVFVHMVRIHIDEADLGRSKAAQKAQFSVREVAELRGVFDSWARWEASASPEDEMPTAASFGAGVAVASSEIAESEQLRLSIVGMIRVLYSVEVRMTAKMRQVLERKIEQVKGNNRDTGDGMDFTGFLLVMRWMLETNFGDINGKALTHAMEEKAGPASQPAIAKTKTR